MEWYVLAFRRYAEFNGRASRKAYWMFTLFNLLISAAVGVLAGLLSLGGGGMDLIVGIYMLAAFLPGLALTVRRLHDTDRSGWWVLVSFLPMVGPLILMVFMALDSDAGDNRFGPCPKGLPPGAF